MSKSQPKLNQFSAECGQGSSKGWINIQYWFPRAALTKYHRLRGAHTTETYPTAVLEAKGLTLRCRPSTSRGSGRAPLLPLPSFWCCWQSLVLLPMSLHHSNRCLLVTWPSSSSVSLLCVSMSKSPSFFKDTCHCIRVHPNLA